MQTNNRGITLMSTTAKLYTRVLSRICNTLDSHFRQTKQLNFIITFIDFKKAFDSIRWSAWKHTGCIWHPREAAQCSDGLDYGAKAVVTMTDGEADTFELSPWVLQGDTLTPYLFALVVDYVLRYAIPVRPIALPSVHVWVPDHEHLLHLWHQTWTLQMALLFCSHTTMMVHRLCSLL